MKIAILGVGAYGIALAKVFFKNDNKVSMWSKFKEERDSILLNRENKRVLPGVKIPKDIEITSDLKSCVDNAKIIVLAVPTKSVREVAKELNGILKEDQVICLVSKGIERSSNMLLSDVVYEETKSEKICMLSGPSFAAEVAKGSEVGLVVASKSQEANMSVKVCLENENVVVEAINDIVGVQVCAATKNVFAILVGMVDATNKNDSCRAAVITRVLNDLRVIVEVLGGKAHTVFSYAGVGDLLLTCMSEKSRNYTFGKYIGSGLDIDEALTKMKVTTIEGLYTLDSVLKLLEEKQIKIKSLEFLYNSLYRNEKVEDILRNIK